MFLELIFELQTKFIELRFMSTYMHVCHAYSTQLSSWLEMLSPS